MAFLSIHLTDLCNSHCVFCVVGAPYCSKDGVDYDQVCTFLRANATNGFSAVNLHGGEPTIHPRFLEVLGLIRSLGYPEVHLQTNGIRLSDISLARQTATIGVRLFIISLHGNDEVIQDQQTGVPGGFRKTIQAIRNAKGLGIPVRTNTVITPENIEHLVQTTKLAIDLGVEHINFSNLHPVGSASIDLGRRLLPFYYVRNALYPAIDLALERGRHVTLEGFPYCTVPERLDLHLDHEHREICMLYRGNVIEDYEAFMNSTMRTRGIVCGLCAAKNSCGGVYKEYAGERGWNEFRPLRPDEYAASPASSKGERDKR